MFGFAHGFTFFFIISALVRIADKIGPSQAVQRDDVVTFIAILMLSWVAGITAQVGLKNAIQKYSKH